MTTLDDSFDDPGAPDFFSGHLLFRFAGEKNGRKLFRVVGTICAPKDTGIKTEHKLIIAGSEDPGFGSIECSIMTINQKDLTKDQDKSLDEVIQDPEWQIYWR